MPYTNTSPTFFLAIDDIPMATPAWRQQNLPELFLAAQQRGSDRLIPTLAGRKPYQRRRDTTAATVAVHVFGDQDWEGNANTDPLGGIIESVLHLRDNVCAPTGTGDGTRSAVITFPTAAGGSDTISADVHVGPLEIGTRAPSWWVVTFDLSIPAGEFS